MSRTSRLWQDILSVAVRNSQLGSYYLSNIVLRLGMRRKSGSRQIHGWGGFV